MPHRNSARNSRRWPYAIALLVLWGARAGGAQAAPPRLSITVACEPTIALDRRAPVATLRWPSAIASPTAQLQVSVYRSGFARGMYASFAVAVAPTSLVHSAATPARDHTLAEYDLRADSVQRTRDTVAVRVKGMKHGIVYYWRVAWPDSTSTLPVSASASTCDSDRIGR